MNSSFVTLQNSIGLAGFLPEWLASNFLLMAAMNSSFVTLQNSIGLAGFLHEWLASNFLLMPSILIGSAGQSSPPKVITLRGGRTADMAAPMNMRKTTTR